MEYTYIPKLHISAYIIAANGRLAVGRTKETTRIVDWLTKRMGEHGERWLYKTSTQGRVTVIIVSFERSADKLLFDLAWSDQLGTIYNSFEQAYKDKVNEFTI